jgi:hypothetical protein
MRCSIQSLLLLEFLIGSFIATGSAEAAIVTQNLSSGTFANPGLVAGAAHSTGTAITWNYTGNFNDPRYVAYVSTFNTAGNFQIFHTTHMGFGNATSNTVYGPDVPVGTPAYTGVEFYYVTFNLPANAINVGLSFSRIGADDRLQFQLNNQLIGYWGGPSTPGAIGRMNGLGSQPTVTNVTFNPVPLPNLTNQSLFNIGGQNVMRFWVNNTFSTNLNANAVPHQGSGDPSVLDIRATLTYDTVAAPVVPEPSSLVVFALTFVMGFSSFRRQRKLGSGR